MAQTITRIGQIDEVILAGLSEYVRGRCEEIVAKHTNEAVAEIDKAIREEVSRTVLSIGKMVSVRNNGTEITIAISDERERK